MITSTSAPPDPRLQAETLIESDIHRLAGIPETLLRDAAAAACPGDLLVVHPDCVPPSVFAPLIHVGGRPGFVVSDMTDVDHFGPVVALPKSPVYVVSGLDRGDDMANWSPTEAHPALDAGGRTPLTLGEGLQWVLHLPEVLERGHCFMTIGSRLRKVDGALDTRTPALWFSNGTGRDGPHHRNAPKVGWCWAGNRHTWLGFASAAGRRAVAGTLHQLQEGQHLP